MARCPECGAEISVSDPHSECLDEAQSRVEIDWSTYEGDDDMPYDPEDGSR